LNKSRSGIPGSLCDRCYSMCLGLVGVAAEVWQFRLD
jgi:hypothetical protein